MSDLCSRLRRRRHELLSSAIGLDFHMWEATRYRPAPPAPYPFPSMAPGFGESFKLHYSQLAQRIYWERKPAARSGAHRSDMPASLKELLEDSTDSRRNTAVRDVAQRLGISTRHVRRALAALFRAGKIPEGWLVGREWRPPVDEAVAVITAARKRNHAPYTKARHDELADYVAKCREEADQLKRDLDEIDRIVEICDQWYFLTLFMRASPPEGSSPWARQLHRRRELRRAYNFMERVAERWRWSFCRLLVALYKALMDHSKAPIDDAKASLGLDHSAFYRNYSSEEIREALQAAERALANPHWLGYGRQPDPQPEGVEYAFSDGSNKVSEADLWADTH